MRSKKIINILMALCIVAIGVTVFGVSRELYVRWQGRSFYTATLSAVVRRSQTQPLGQGSQNTAGGSIAEGTRADVDAPWIPYVDFYALQELIPTVIAWIVADGTVIDYPIVQWTDNYYFLSRLPDGTSNRMGSIFLDYRNNPDFTDQNSVIYGHQMRSGDMFTQLEFYRDQAFFDRHPFIMLYTPERDYKIELFAGYVANAHRETIPVEFNDTEDFERFISEVRRRSLFQSDIVVNTDDRLVTLVTCTYTNYANARFVVVGRIVDVT